METNTSNTSIEEPIPHLLDINGVKLNMLDWGGVGDPILILHATGFLGRIYRPIAEMLKTIGHVYSYDQRGQGDSPHQDTNVYNWDNTLLDLQAVIEHMGWKNINAVGHSAGATAIGALSAHCPHMINRAFLIDPVIFDFSQGTFNEHPMRDRTLKRRAQFDSIDAMFKSYKQKPPFNTWREDVLLDYCTYGTRVLLDGRRELKCSPKVEATMYDTGRFFDGLSKILQSPRPLLFLFSAQSYFAQFAPLLAKSLPSAQIEVNDELGHLMAMENPDFIANRALDYFSCGS